MLRITVPVHISWCAPLGFYASKEMRRLVRCLLKMHDLSELAFASFVTLISSRVAGSAWSTDLSVLSLGEVCWCLLQSFAPRSNRELGRSAWMKTPWLLDSKFVLGHAVALERRDFTLCYSEGIIIVYYCQPLHGPRSGLQVSAYERGESSAFYFYLVLWAASWGWVKITWSLGLKTVLCCATIENTVGN